MGAINHADIGGLSHHCAPLAAQQQASSLTNKPHSIELPRAESDPHDVSTQEDTIHRQSAATAIKHPQKKAFGYTPLFNWEKDGKTFSIIPSETSAIPSPATQLESSTPHIASFFGYKIDITDQVDQLKMKLQKYFIESKSYNPLIGKFSELKFGVMLSMLSLLGIEPNTIETLKKDALKKAIDENIYCFEENEYNAELLLIFKSKKKDNGRIKVLKKLQEQLIKQMTHYGKPNFYTNETICLIKQKQVQKIQQDLLEEHQNLSYIRNFQ